MWIDNGKIAGRIIAWKVGILLVLFVPAAASVSAAEDTNNPASTTRTSLSQGPSHRLFSPSVGRSFYELAYELSRAEQISPAELEQAVTLLKATIELDDTAQYVLDDMIMLIARDQGRNYTELMGQLFGRYVDNEADLYVVRSAVDYLLKGTSTREEREKVLGGLLQAVGGRNNMVASELATKLGLLQLEKPDIETAQKFFIAAYNYNNYNRVAFSKLVELLGDQIKPTIYLGQLRLLLRENPLDIETALSLAGRCEQYGLYDTAAQVYRYCAELFTYLYPSESLPSAIYLPWAVSCYNTEHQQQQCLNILAQVRNSGKFDLLLEAVAGKAALKMGQEQLGRQILQSAAARAAEILSNRPGEQPDSRASVTSEQMAWFYCFVMPDANKAVVWANRAYSSQPNSPVAAGILAYALVMNKQTDWPKLLIDNYERTQISELALAGIEFASGRDDSAVAILKSAIERDPGSLAAERAKQVLAEHGVKYAPAVDAGTVLSSLKAEFGEQVVPKFVTPDKMVRLGLKFRGTRFSYGAELEGQVKIENIWTEPLWISDDGMLKGDIRIDAVVSGDLQQRIQKVVSMRVLPSKPIEPGRSLFVPVHLQSGRLGQLLQTHPQALLKIEFTVYMDPVVEKGGQVHNRIVDIAPGRALIERAKVELSAKYLQNRLDSLVKGRRNQKVRAGLLFAGLLKELQSTAEGEPPYPLMYAEWMPQLLTSALVRNLEDDDWTVRVQTMASMLGLSLDYELTRAVAKNLHNSYWPCRLTALYLLARTDGPSFSKVLNWAAKYDSNRYVRQMARALGEQFGSTAEQPVDKRKTSRSE